MAIFNPMKLTIKQLRNIIAEEVQRSLQETNGAAYKTGQRVVHAMEPDMYGTVESAYDDEDEVRVKWDGGVAQYVSKSEITPLRGR